MDLATLSECIDTRAVRTRWAPDRRTRYAELLTDADRVVLVAVNERTDAVVGVAVATDDEIGALLPMRALTVNHLVVAPDHRRRGVGRALLAGVVRSAEERGIDQVVVAVTNGDREANRYLARLGFTPLVVRRVAGVPALRRTLGMAHTDRAEVRRRRGVRTVLSARVASRGA
ncbi:MAG: GNAT family N-acetyltransferase [bacterium]